MRHFTSSIESIYESIYCSNPLRKVSNYYLHYYYYYLHCTGAIGWPVVCLSSCGQFSFGERGLRGKAFPKRIAFELMQRA